MSDPIRKAANDLLYALSKVQDWGTTRVGDCMDALEEAMSNSSSSVKIDSEERLTSDGVFKGAHGLKGLLESQSFWDDQPYGTRLYYGDGVADYLHRDVLRTAVKIIEGEESNEV
jgi:hypothetical protein